MINWLFSLFLPLIIHMVLSEMTVIFGGEWGNAALCTTVAAVLVIPIAGWMFFQDKKKKPKQEDGKTARNLFRFGLLCFVAGGVLNMVWSGVLNLFQIGTFFSNHTQEELLAADILLQLIGLGILVPVGEELIFRGLIYNRMKQLLGTGVSVFFSSFLFAVYHGNPIQMIFAFPMALALTAVYEYGNSFWFPVLFHVGANLTAIVLNYFRF